jgi:hypothetical protein
MTAFEFICEDCGANVRRACDGDEDRQPVCLNCQFLRRQAMRFFGEMIDRMYVADEKDHAA